MYVSLKDTSVKKGNFNFPIPAHFTIPSKDDKSNYTIKYFLILDDNRRLNGW